MTAITAANSLPSSRLPLWLKLSVTIWAAIVVPSYAIDSGYGLLWFCNVALILTVIGLWTESPLIISMPAVGNVPWLLLWCLDMTAKLIGSLTRVNTPDGPATYMINSQYPVWARVMSLYHGWLPIVLIYAVKRGGYDPRALVCQTLLGWLLIVAAYLVVPHPNTPAGNVNLVFGYSADRDPVLWVSQPMWVIALMVLCPLVLYLPAHLIYRRIFVKTRG